MKKILFFLLFTSTLTAQTAIQDKIKYTASKKDSLWTFDVIQTESNPLQITRYVGINTQNLQSYFMSKTMSSYQQIGVSGYRALYEEVLANKTSQILTNSLKVDYDSIALVRYDSLYTGTYYYEKSNAAPLTLYIDGLDLKNAAGTVLATITPLSPNYFRLFIKGNGRVLDMYSENEREWLGKHIETGELYYFRKE